MSKAAASKTVNIFLALEKNAIAGYFNPHDISPIYKRQLSVKLEHYIRQSLQSCKRHDPVFFKLNCSNKADEQYAEPLMYAIRRHYNEKRAEEQKAFAKFKRKNYGVIIGSMILVAGLNLLLPLVMSKKLAFEIGMSHFIDVFSFIIFYHPLTELLFNWNPHLKRLNLLNKVVKAEAIIVAGDRNSTVQSFEEYENTEDVIAPLL